MAAASLGQVPPISGYRDDVSPSLEAIALRALERAPAARYQTAGEMRDELERYLHTEAMPPTSREVTQWMQSLGGVKRSGLKMSIAQGRNVAASYAELMALRWDETSAPATPSSGTRRRRSAWHLAAFAGVSLAVMVGAGLATEPREPRPLARPALASARLDSDPPGAFIFVRGEPTGQLTPATFTGLDPSEPLEFRLEKPGHASVGGRLALKPGAVASRRLTLVANKGVVRFTNLPRGALVRIGGVVALPEQEVIITPGQQVAELVVGGEVVATHTLTIAPGPQDLELPPVTP
jgi:serine/threonine-protein kinase